MVLTKKNSDTKMISFFRLKVPPWVVPWPQIMHTCMWASLNRNLSLMVHNIPFSQTLYFGRYIDDIFMLWSGTGNQLLQFHSFINTSDEHLRFTVNYDDSCVNFLDIRIIRGGKK